MGTSGQLDLARGFNHSIYFMLGMMLLIGAAFGWMVWSSYRRGRGDPAHSDRLREQGRIRW